MLSTGSLRYVPMNKPPDRFYFWGATWSWTRVCNFIQFILNRVFFCKRNSTAILPTILNKLENGVLSNITVEPRFNEPLYYEFFVTMNNLLQPGQNYSKMYGSEPRFNEILVITNTIHKQKRKICLDIMNKCQHAIKDECQTDQQG